MALVRRTACFTLAHSDHDKPKQTVENRDAHFLVLNPWVNLKQNPIPEVMHSTHDLVYLLIMRRTATS
jgi:hypothetical protein